MVARLAKAKHKKHKMRKLDLDVAAGSSRVSAGTGATFAFKAKHLPRHTKLQLQRQAGSAHVWQKVRKLRAHAGTVTSPRLQMGVEVFRLAVMGAHHAVLAHSKSRTVHVYGPVSVGVLCNGSIDSYICGTDDTGVITTGDHTFSYTGETNNGYRPPYWTVAFGMGRTSCRALHVEFAAYSDVSSAVLNLQVVQSATDPHTSSTQVGTVGTLNASLDGSPFTVRGNSSNGAGIYFNGTADCYTASGQA